MFTVKIENKENSEGQNETKCIPSGEPLIFFQKNLRRFPTQKIWTLKICMENSQTTFKKQQLKLCLSIFLHGRTNTEHSLIVFKESL